MPIAAMPLDRRRSGDSSRNSIFCGEVSTFVTLLSSLFVDSMSSHPLLRLSDTSIYQEFNANDHGCYWFCSRVVFNSIMKHFVIKSYPGLLFL